MRRVGHGARATGLAFILIGLCRTSFAEPLAGSARGAAPPVARAEPRVVRNVRYGSDIRQRLDVYAPPDAKGAPVIFMVHGGGWAYGDKSARGVTANKVKRWVPRGFIVISTNYRLLPKADPLEQAKDIARAIAVAQQRVPSWGGDPGKFILMGHSAGGHLVALLNASPALAGELPITPWLGAVSIESGALDVVEIILARGLTDARPRAGSRTDARRLLGSPPGELCALRPVRGAGGRPRVAGLGAA